MLEVRNLGVAFETSLFTDLSFSVADDETIALLGPSGAGKSSLLRAIAGLIPIRSGSVMVNGRDLASTAPHKRGIGLVFQDNALLPHLTVGENIEYGLRSQRRSRQERNKIVTELLHMMKIEALAKRRVDTLSGGEAKRVAVARTLAPRPAVVLLDEPLTGLDQTTYEPVLNDVMMMLRSSHASAIWVTHDETEAARVAKRIIRL
jgi:thiamine transport system ATP-binding protein